MSVAVDVGVGCEIDCRACSRRSRVGLEVVVVGGIAAEVGIEGKVGDCIGLAVVGSSVVECLDEGGVLCKALLLEIGVKSIS